MLFCHCVYLFTKKKLLLNYLKKQCMRINVEVVLFHRVTPDPQPYTSQILTSFHIFHCEI